MEPFRTHTGLAAPLLRQDIDTDQIVPKEFLKRIDRSGFGRVLFHHWRVRSDGTPDPRFVLNDARFAGASILIAGPNFGCGSSREHAAWALLDYGIRAIVAPSFADIFRSNAVGNGLLPVTLSGEVVASLGERAARGDGYRLTIDLERLRVSDGEGHDVPFELDGAARNRLLNGWDDIALILRHEDAIRRFEQRQAR